MTRLRVFLVRLRGLFQNDARLTEELASHLEMLTAEHQRRGLPPEEARAAARRDLGPVTPIRESHRDLRRLPFVDSLLQDLRYTLRQWRSHPGFTAAAILTLALAIGANTAIFQLLDVIVLRSLPVRHPEQFVRLQGYQGEYRLGFDYPLLREMSARQHSVQGIFASSKENIREARAGGRQIASLREVWFVSANYFRLIGTDPQIGRFFTEADDETNAAPVAVISNRLWRAEFGAQPAAVGSTIHLNKTAVTIIGVARPEFFGDRVGTPSDIWVPLRLAGPLVTPFFLQGGARWLRSMARLRPGVPLVQAQAELSLLWGQLHEEFGKRILSLPASYRMELVPAPRGSGDLPNQYSRPLSALMAIAGLVALIACCNLANLLLARATARAQEMSVRLAIGAARGRLIRQLLTESLALSVAGGGLGLALAALASSQLTALASGEAWRISTAVDWRIGGFTLLVTLGCTVLFGLAPAFASTRAGLGHTLQRDRRTQTGDRSRHAAARAFVVAQVALSLVLVAGASLLVRSFWKLTHQDFGFRPKGVLIATMGADMSNIEDMLNTTKPEQIVQRLRGTPGVHLAAWAIAGPLGSITGETNIALPGRALPSGAASAALVSSGYFETMGIPVLSGRPIGVQDRKDAPKVAVLSESAARLMVGNGNAVGEFFTEGKAFDRQKAIQVVGVVRDLPYSSPRAPFGPVVFYPTAQRSVNANPELVLRTEGDPMQFASVVRQAVREAAPTLRVDTARTLVSMVDDATRRERLLAWLGGAFGGLALILAAVGLYGVIAYTAARRTPEMGIRLALGANPFQIRALLLREFTVLLAIGLVLGWGATVLFTRWLDSLLFDLTPQDPATLAFAAALLSAVAIAAGYFPARRAARLDPMTALRAE